MKKIICNPLNLEYRYQIKKEGKIPLFEGAPPDGIVFREAADPTMIVFQDTYFLFVSMTGGFWYSEDLLSWKFKETPELPIYDYAPDVHQVGNAILFSASKSGEPCTFFRSEDPLTKPFEPVSSPFSFWDPAVFQDDDGRVYLYWGCSNSVPICGVEIDPVTLYLIGDKVPLVVENIANHGWERRGENNALEAPKTPVEKAFQQRFGSKPFIEGAFMTKHENLYYFQYAGPGTEYNIYGNGVYVGTAPLGPFTYQNHNPFSSKPGGFMTGAGHGSTFQDKYKNWWHITTMRISVNDSFERRLGLFPCFFDKDGILYCDQNFGDFPFSLPDKKWDNAHGAEPLWMMLSYNKKVTASSFQKGYEPEKGVNEDARDWWAAASRGKDQWYQLDLEKIQTVCAVQINFADHQGQAPDIDKTNMQAENNGDFYRKIMTRPQSTKYLLEASTDGETWFVLRDVRTTESDYAHDLILLPEPKQIRFLRVSDMELPFNIVPSISGLRVFGLGNEEKPSKVNAIEISRKNRLDILLQWEPALGAIGYNVRYGIASNKLYASWQVYGENSLKISTVSRFEGYYISVDSFNENGVTKGAVVFVE